ncbi:unnamed protein product, partial [Mesorhabditis belari]|uniref:Transposase n=1 Tax=Mesorhabditis belari TaxID=2138241 RepID=A0AAF3F809_9BILA
MGNLAPLETPKCPGFQELAEIVEKRTNRFKCLRKFQNSKSLAFSYIDRLVLTEKAPKPTPKPDIHGKKVMLCVWWNSKGLVYFEVLDSGQTVTANLYQGQLDRVDQALRRQGVDMVSTKFLHDNARPHVAKIIQQKIEEMGWEVLPHPPYSPDLAPSDYHLFRSMHHSLAEKKFKNRDEVQIWVSNFFESQPVEFFKKDIHSLRERWRQVIDADGEYLLD